jgi:hypothetical protein
MPNLAFNAAYYLWLGINTAFGAGTITAATALATVKFIAVTAASMAASKLLAPKPPSFADSSMASRSQMVRSPISARTVAYGRSRVSGTMVYVSTTGTANEYLHIVVALAGHEIEEIEEIYFNDELVPLDPIYTNEPTGFYAGVARVNKHLGEPTQLADSDLVSDTASLTDGRWTSDHKLSGIAYVYVRLTWDTEKYPSGIPNISAVIKGKKVLDTRTSTTAYSANPALCLRDYLTDSALGMGMDATEIDVTAINAAANICDEQVEILPITIPANYEDRYECNGVIATSAAPDENIGKLLSAMGGLIAYSGGKIVTYAGGYRIPTVTLDEKHFVGPLNVQTRTSARDRVNTVKGVYVSETNAWQVSDFPSISSVTYTTADGGVKFIRDVVLPFTTSPSCAQRLGVIELRRAREEITFTARFRLEAMQVRAGDTVMITNAKLGWSSKVFEVMEWHFASDGNPPQLFIDMTLRETASSVYSWTVGDQIAVADAANTTLPNPFTLDAPTNLVLTADGTTQLIQADGTALPRIKVEWTPPSEQFIQSGGAVVIEYKPTASTTYLTWSRVEGTQDEDYISSDVKIGTAYNVRIFGESYFRVTTDYVTASITVVADNTAPATPSGLVASAGTGQVVSLDWNDNTEPDLGDYGVWRNTSDTPSTATQIARVRASRFVDVTVTIGTTYYYWVTAYDRLENQSAKSTVASVAPTAVGSTDIADFSITTQKLADNAVSQIKLQDAIVSNAKLVDAAVDAVKIATAAITEIKIDTGAVTAAKIAAAAITETKIATDAVTSAKIIANAITSDKIVANAITTAKISSSAVEADKIAANAVVAGKIAANAVTAGTIAANAVTAGTINAGAVTAGTIAAGAVTATTIGANEIITNTANIADATILSAKIASLAANKISAGTLNAMTLTAAKTATDTEFFNTGTTSSTFPSVSFQRHEDGTVRTSLGVGGTVVWLTTFYGWATGTGFVNDRYGKSNMNFISMCNAGGTVALGSYLDLEIVYNLNGGATIQVTPFASRALDNNGSLNLSGGLNLTGLTSTDQVNFGIRAKSDDNATSLNVVSLVTLAINV